ncbi:MAG: hypothetical protein Q7K29_04110, partial [Thermoleophilia bacterium]|nr:hypothetical protein [Thermoleophilia bacterium]
MTNTVSGILSAIGHSTLMVISYIAGVCLSLGLHSTLVSVLAAFGTLLSGAGALRVTGCDPEAIGRNSPVTGGASRWNTSRAPAFMLLALMLLGLFMGSTRLGMLEECRMA